MTYAVMQTGLEPPSTEQLEKAFVQVPGLTAFDVLILGKDACGVLVKGFELNRASAMQSALAAQGIATEVVEDAALTELPLARQLNKVDLSPEAFLIYDLMGRSSPLPWNDIAVIAAGRARLTEFTSELTTKLVITSPRDSAPKVGLARQTREEQKNHLLLEIITRGAALRYNTAADRPEALLLFGCLGERRSREPLPNLLLFVQEMAKYAPAAILNYGACNLCEQRDPSFTYASKTAFYREITWLLWMASTGRMRP
jgi:hypothetical protein